MRFLFVALLSFMLLSAALAAETPAPVTLTNPGFEEQVKGWQEGDPLFAGAFKAETGQHHQGKAALHLTAADPEQWPWVGQEASGIEGGATYTLKAWYLGAKGGQADAAIKIEFLDAKSQPLGGDYVRQPANQDKWQQLTVAALAPDNAVKARVMLRLMGDGNVWFDDVELARTAQPAALTILPAHLAATTGKAEKVKLQVALRQDWQGDPAQAKLSLLAANGRPIKQLKTPFALQGKRQLTAEVDLPALPPADFLLRVTAPAGAAETRICVTLAKRQPKDLNDRGFLLNGDKPYFPIGIYHAAVSDYRLLAAQGFNCVQGFGGDDAAPLAASINVAQSDSLHLDMPLYAGGQVAKNLPVSLRKVSAYARNPNIYSWKIMDEPELHPAVRDEVPDAYRRLKQVDPNQAFTLTLAAPASCAYWANFCDVLEMTAFPLPHQPLSMVAKRLAEADQALEAWQGLIAVLPAGWSTAPGNQPTFDQARLMVYLAIIAGARGIFWYSLRDPGWTLITSPLWKQFKQLNEETAALGQIAAGGVRVPATVDNDKVFAGAWTIGGKPQVMIANPETTDQTVTIKLPKPVGQMHVVKGIAVPMIKDGAIELTLPASSAVLLAAGAGPAPKPAAKKPAKSPAQPPAGASTTPPATTPAKPAATAKGSVTPPPLKTTP